MATPAAQAQAAQLTAAQRDAQYAQNQLVALIVAEYFASLGDRSYEAQIADLLSEVVPFLQQRRLESATLAEQFYRDMRQLLVPGAKQVFEILRADELPLEAVRSSLIYTGPAALRKKLADGMDPDQAMAEAKDAVGSAAGRHVANGGRETVINTANADPVALGWMRVLKSTDPCYYCVMLVSRGPVYKEDSFAESDPRFVGPGDAKVHDHCHCTMTAVFDRSDPAVTAAASYDTLWAESTKGFSGPGAVNAFRRAWEGRSTEAA